MMVGKWIFRSTMVNRGHLAKIHNNFIFIKDFMCTKTKISSFHLDNNNSILEDFSKANLTTLHKIPFKDFESMLIHVKSVYSGWNVIKRNHSSLTSSLSFLDISILLVRIVENNSGRQKALVLFSVLSTPHLDPLRLPFNKYIMEVVKYNRRSRCCCCGYNSS